MSHAGVGAVGTTIGRTMLAHDLHPQQTAVLCTTDVPLVVRRVGWLFALWRRVYFSVRRNFYRHLHCAASAVFLLLGGNAVPSARQAKEPWIFKFRLVKPAHGACLTKSTMGQNGEKMKIRIDATLMSLCLLLPAPAFAQSKLTEKYSDDQLIQIFKDDGYGAVSKLRDGAIKIKIDGSTYIIYNNTDGDLQSYYAIGGTKISYEDINEWNQTKRLSRAYLDSDKDTVIESDLLANGGLNTKHVTEFFRIFKSSVKAFRAFIIEKNKN